VIIFYPCDDSDRYHLMTLKSWNDAA